MANHTTIFKQQCFSYIPTIPLLLMLSICATPLHILISKVLIQRFRLTLPRHRILLCLSISDGCQILCATLFFAVGRAINPWKTSLTCQTMRRASDVLAMMSHCASSGFSIALSIERYIACVHSLRLHVLVTSERVNRALFSICVISIALGLLVIDPQTKNYSVGVAIDRKPFSVVFAIIAFLSSITLAIIQLRLYRITRLKHKVTPHHMLHGAQEEGRDLLKRHIKLAISASVVVILYILCMFPISCLLLYHLLYPNNDSKNITPFLGILAITNTFADPFVYGFGMADVRGSIKKEYCKLTNCIFSCAEKA